MPPHPPPHRIAPKLQFVPGASTLSSRPRHRVVEDPLPPEISALLGRPMRDRRRPALYSWFTCAHVLSPCTQIVNILIASHRENKKKIAPVNLVPHAQ